MLVTGGAGFIGSALARALLGAGHEVIVADNLSTGYRENVPPGAEFIEIDLGNREEYGKLEGTRFDTVCHLAGQSSGEASFRDPWYDYNSHATSTFLLLELCRSIQARRFLYASSMSVYGDPRSVPVDEDHPTRPKTYYAAGKLAAEGYIRLADTLDMDTTIFRMFSVYGPNQNLANRMQGMISIYLSYVLDNQPILVKGAKQRFRDFVCIDDVIGAWIAALDNPRAHGKTYNLASGSKTSVEELLQALRQALGNPDYPVEFGDNTPGDQFGMVAAIGRLRDDLGWTPRVELAEGLARMVDFHTSRRAG